MENKPRDLIVRSLNALADAPKTTTIESVLRHQAVTDLGRKGDGSLSEGQMLLLTTVVSIMQDDISNEIRNQRDVLLNELRAQRSVFVELSKSAAMSLIGFAKGGMFTAPKKDEDDARPVLIRALTWGNFFAGAAIVMVAIAGYTTHTYLAYKDLADVRKSEIERLSSEIGRMTSELVREKGKTQSQVDLIQEKDRTLYDRGSEITILKSRLEVKEVKEESELQKQLADAQIKAAYANAAAEKSGAQLPTLKERVATLIQVVKDKDDEIRRLTQANREKSEAIESLTYKLGAKS
jgi:hypothetical protein